MRVIDNLYAYVWRGNDNNGNSYVLTQALPDKRHLIVDPGHIVTPFYREPALQMLVQGMEADGINAADIGLVILTHAHPDHCESAAVFQEKCQARVALHRDDEPVYRSFGGKVDIYLEEGESTPGPGVRLNVFHSPGHSPGHIALYLPEPKALIAGDVVFYQSTGRVDLPGGSARALKASIQRLSKLDVEYLLCGHPYGHPGVIQGKSAVRENFDFILKYFF